jgi:hypothetical protein
MTKKSIFWFEKEGMALAIFIWLFVKYKTTNNMKLSKEGNRE